MERLLDTSTLIECEKGRLDLAAELINRRISRVLISTVTASELLHGAHRAVDPGIRARRVQFVESLFYTFSIAVIDLPTARIHSRLWADLQSTGSMISQHDLWLAATCIRYNVAMVTCNVRDFSRIPGLAVENWLTNP